MDEDKDENKDLELEYEFKLCESETGSHDCDVGEAWTTFWAEGIEADEKDNIWSLLADSAATSCWYDYHMSFLKDMEVKVQAMVHTLYILAANSRDRDDDEDDCEESDNEYATVSLARFVPEHILEEVSKIVDVNDRTWGKTLEVVNQFHVLTNEEYKHRFWAWAENASSCDYDEWDTSDEDKT